MEIYDYYLLKTKHYYKLIFFLYIQSFFVKYKKILRNRYSHFYEKDMRIENFEVRNIFVILKHLKCVTKKDFDFFFQIL